MKFLLWLLKKLGWRPTEKIHRVEVIKEVPVIREKIVEVIKEVPVENKQTIVQEVVREVEVVKEIVVEREKVVEREIRVVEAAPVILTQEQRDKIYWDNKWPKADIAYYGRILKNDANTPAAFWNFFQLAVDVKSFILENDSVMKYIVDKYGLKKQTHDATMHAIQKFVCDGTMSDFYAGGDYRVYEASEVLSSFRKRPKKVLTYAFDDERLDAPDYWLFPFETAACGFGDCEDGAILIASLAINAGVPSYRVKVACGYVSDGKVEGGHAYCIYLASDGEWRILDWCYWPDQNVPVLYKPLAKSGGVGGYYKDVWFTFNNEHAWNQKSLAIYGRLDYVDDIEDILLD